MVVRRLTPMECISIHAPARGGDMKMGTKITKSLYFNPRPREGGRRRCLSWLGRGCYFNPRPRAGGRPRRRPVL